MSCLYIEAEREEENRLSLSIESAACLALAVYLDSPVSIFILPLTSSPRVLFTIPSDMKLESLDKPTPLASLCCLPVITLDDGISCVAGLSAVLRQIAKESPEEGSALLGFRNSCLAAPSETSPFVWFCEVAVVRGESNALDRLEHHLSLPVRVHNAGKYKTFMSENGRFVEGPHFLLTDIVLAISVNILIQRLPEGTLNNYPLISSWLSRVTCEKDLNSVLNLIEVLPLDEEISPGKFTNRPLASLYKRDPTRYKPRHKIFTQQSEIESCLEIVSSVKMMDISRLSIAPLPSFVPLPDVPSSRKERKSQQIHSFISAALKVIREGDIVVDFCAGSGHVGLAVASCLPPSCRVILLDAKEGSLTRARQKVAELNLNNIWLVQANLGYFSANFNVGMALHACGVASDLVLQKCLDKGASLVLCPCCYGGIQTNDKVKYPHSQEFRETGLTERGYIVLGHCADQSGVQGERSMLAVDTDRCLAATEKGYKVELTKMEPLTCSTRNNLILAVKE